MIKKVIVFSVIAVVSIASLAVFISNLDEISGTESTESVDIFETESSVQGDVVMPTKVSRPGCEEENRCYIPSVINIERGEQVTWVNEDSAFHSVTSGFYDAPTDLFDSGYLDPYESYSFTFDKSGTFDYFCTLHPWMKGKVIVE